MLSGLMIGAAETTRTSTGRGLEPRVCLCMIVRNERRIIERCLEAAAPVVDAVSVCDTGSDDGTADAIADWVVAHGLPGRVHRHRWRDFGHNRTRSIRAARRMLRRLAWDLRRTYL